MGGGDLNMKKSWHPLLLKNQERVWLEEKKALEEKKKLDQLRKEREEERAMQELQRMQEEQTGKKRVEKLEWLYNTPATGSSTNANDLEDYLLGRKRVDKMLIGDENKQVGAAHKNFIAVQNANNARDTAAKIREDPLLAIKQQEQAAYQELISNPLRLRAMQEKAGIKVKDKKSKKEKKEKERDRGRKRRHSDASETGDRPRRWTNDSSRSHSQSRSRSREAKRSRYDDRSEHRRPRSPHSRSRSPARRDSYSYESRSRRRDSPHSRRRRRSRSRSPERRNTYHGHTSERRRSPPRARSRSPPSRYEPRREERSEDKAAPPPPPAAPLHMNPDRAARLAAMSSNAQTLTADRRDRLHARLEQEKLELAREEASRARTAKDGGKSRFLLDQERKFMDVGLGEKMRRGRGGMVGSTD